MESRFIRAEDVAAELGISRPYAYKFIRQLNEELRKKGVPHRVRESKSPVF